MTDEQLAEIRKGIDGVWKHIGEHANGIKQQMANHTGQVLTRMDTLERKLDKIMKHLKISDDGR